MAYTQSIDSLQKVGTAAVKRLRKQKLQNGLPFMVNSKDLPKGQSYIEYPDGRIVLVAIAESHRDYKILIELSAEKTHQIRLEYQLF